MSSAPVVSLAERLRQRREELGMSQAQAARELDVARTAYRLWELEAAKPAPDRWRLIASWLGVSVTTMLLAEELVTAEEAAHGDIVAFDFRRSPHDTQETGAPRSGFFAQARALIAEGGERGEISSEQAEALGVLVARIEQERIETQSHGWEETEIRRMLPASELAPRAAREALTFASAGVPESVLQTALLLASELVTNSVRHGPTDGRIDFVVNVRRDLLRVEVSDGSSEGARPVAVSQAGGYGLTFVATLASRWGAGHDGDRNVTWFELDLPLPGGPTKPDLA